MIGWCVLSFQRKLHRHQPSTITSSPSRNLLGHSLIPLNHSDFLGCATRSFVQDKTSWLKALSWPGQRQHYAHYAMLLLRIGGKDQAWEENTQLMSVETRNEAFESRCMLKLNSETSRFLNGSAQTQEQIPSLAKMLVLRGNGHWDLQNISKKFMQSTCRQNDECGTVATHSACSLEGKLSGRPLLNLDLWPAEQLQARNKK